MTTPPKAITVLCAIIAAILLCGCGAGWTICHGKYAPAHSWSKWTKEWEKSNANGYMRQTRQCIECGWTEVMTR